MLVLSRREKQRIKLGKDITITVVRLAGDKVRLGIDAPADVVVLREELEARADAAATALKSEVAGESLTALSSAPPPRLAAAG